MKNTFLHSSNRRRWPGVGTNRAFFAICIVVVLIGVAYVFTPTFFTRAAYAIAVPLWGVEAVIEKTASAYAALLKSKWALVQKNAELSARLRHNSVVDEAYALLEEENADLKALLGKEQGVGSTLGAVLVRPLRSPYDTLVINVGSVHGVREGDYVVAPGTVVIGTIETVFLKSARVVLFSAPGVLTQVEVGPSHIETAARGRGGGNFTARLPREAIIAKGDIITIPGIEPGLFAVVERIELHPTDPFQTILFKNPINMHELSFVYVVHDPPRM